MKTSLDNYTTTVHIESMNKNTELNWPSEFQQKAYWDAEAEAFADSARVDWLLTLRGKMWFCDMLGYGREISRRTIDEERENK
jgi:hypothetical protein